MALPAGRYGVTKNQLLKIKKLPMNTIKLIEELTEKFNLLGTAAFKNSTSVVTDSTDLVESGAVKDIVGWGNANKLPPVIWHLNNTSTFNGDSSDTNPIRTRTTPAFAFPFPSQTFEISGLPSCITALNGVKCFDSTKTEIGMAQVSGYKFTTLANTAYIYILFNGENITVADMANAQIMVCHEGTTPTSYEPYHASVEESKYNRSEANVLGAKNLLDTSVEKSVGINTMVVNTDTGLRVYTTSADTYRPISFLVDIPKDANLCLVSTAQVTKGKGSVSVVGIKQDDTVDNLATSSEFNSNTNVKLLFNSGHIYKAYRVYLFCTRGTSEEGDISYNDLMITLSSDTDPTYQPYAQTNRELTVNKADNSVIGTVEDGTTASQAYAVGEHFIRDGAFCTVTQAISSGGTLTEGTNYTSGDVADELTPVDITNEFTFASECNFDNQWTYIYKIGNTIEMQLRFTTPSTLLSDKEIISMPAKYAPRTRKTGLIYTPWNGSIKGIIIVTKPDVSKVLLASNEWITSSNVIAHIVYTI